MVGAMMRLSVDAAWPRAALLAALLLVAGGCASDPVPETEQMLTAAGFRMEPADTPERQAELAGLPPHQVLVQPVRVGDTPTTGYVYADPDHCHCLFVGDAKAYQAFQQLAVQKRIADEYLQAAALNENAAFEWSHWGPGFWGPQPVIIERDLHRRPH
jgi:hypothetical protein